MNEWITATIGSFVENGEISIQTGPFGTQLKASDYVESGTPVINVRNIGVRKTIDSNLEFIGEDTRERLKSHVLKYQDIVFGRKGAVERHAYIDKAHNGWFQGSDCIRMRINSKSLLPQFVSYYLLTPTHKTWMINNCSHGATMASLNQDIIKRIELPIPPINEQKKIIGILSAYDEAIENNNRRIAILEEMAQKLYREWFVHFRFPGHETVKMVEFKRESIPQNWKEVTLGEVATIIMGQSPKSDCYNEKGKGLPFHQGVTNFGQFVPEHRIYSIGGTRIANEGDILFSVRAPVGKINVADRKLILGRGLSAIRHNKGHQAYLLFLLISIFNKPDLIGNGAIFNSVTKEDMRNIKILTASSSVENMFNNLVSPVVTELLVLNEKNASLQKTRDLLLPRLIAGNIDVSNLDIPIKEHSCNE